MDNGAAHQRILLWVLSISMLVVSLTAAIPPVLAQSSSSPGVLPPQSHAHGKSYGEWSAAWWQAILGLPLASNPVLGANCGILQYSRQVWFLTGPPSPDATTRTCTIPTGTALFLPIITGECSTVESAPFFGRNEPELRACARALIDGVGVSTLRATIDGVAVQDLVRYRVQSPLFPFANLPADNFLGVPAGLSGSAVSDGYWLLLHPLSPGQHTIHWEASVLTGPVAGFGQNVTYILNVVPRGQQ
jgi:hypothetical protein